MNTHSPKTFVPKPYAERFFDCMVSTGSPTRR